MKTINAQERKQEILKARNELEISPGLPLGKIFSPAKVEQAFAQSDLEYRDRIFSPSGHFIRTSLAVSQQERFLPRGGYASFSGAASTGLRGLFTEYFQLCSGSAAVTSKCSTESHMLCCIGSSANLPGYEKMGMARPPGQNDRRQYNPSSGYSSQSQSISSTRETEEECWIPDSKSLRTDQFKHRLCE